MTLGVTAFGLAGCSEPMPAPRAPVGSAASQSAEPAGGAAYIQGAIRTYDAELLDLASVVPGFGGLYIEPAAAVVHVYLKAPATLAVARPAIVSFVERLRLLREGPPADVVAHQGNFDYQELTAMYRRAALLLPRRGSVTVTDIDEAMNRIFIGTLDGRARERVAAALVPLAAPAGMIEVALAPPMVTVQAQQTLSDTIRPVPGGVRIRSNQGVTCTAGFNVMIYDNTTATWLPQRYLATNSHCTDTTGEANNFVLGVRFGQPVSAQPIGVEVADAPLVDGHADPFDSCEDYRLCGLSDAALIRYDDNADSRYGFLAVSEIGSTTITSYPKISAGLPALNMAVRKTGAVSGTTAHTINRSCTNVSQWRHVRATRTTSEYWEDLGTDMLCQWQASGALPNYGDSGSPVYWMHSSGSLYEVVGMVWGSAPADYGDPNDLDPFVFTFASVGQVLHDLVRGLGLNPSRYEARIACPYPGGGCFSP